MNTLANYYHRCAYEAFKTSVVLFWVSITCALIGAEISGVVSTLLGSLAILAVILATRAMLAMLRLISMRRHEENRDIAHRNPNKIYL